MVQFQVLPGHALGLAEEAARHPGGYHDAGQTALYVGLREGLAVEEAELEDGPEGLVRHAGIGSQLGAGGQGDAHLIITGSKGYCLGRGERFEAFATGLHGHGGVGRIAAIISLGPVGHVGHVERAAAVYLGGAIGYAGTQGDDNDHDDADGQRRAQHRYPRDDGILAQVVKGLLQIESKHSAYQFL